MESIQQTIDRIKEGKNIIMIGPPASGKTYLSQYFKESHDILHTDDYIQYGYNRQYIQGN